MGSAEGNVVGGEVEVDVHHPGHLRVRIETAGGQSGATEFTYDRTTQPRPKIDPWRSELDTMLAENAGRPKRERLTLVRIYEELRNRGYGGGYRGDRRKP